MDEFKYVVIVRDDVDWRDIPFRSYGRDVRRNKKNRQVSFRHIWDFETFSLRYSFGFSAVRSALMPIEKTDEMALWLKANFGPIGVNWDRVGPGRLHWRHGSQWDADMTISFRNPSDATCFKLIWG